MATEQSVRIYESKFSNVSATRKVKTYTSKRKMIRRIKNMFKIAMNAARV